jgi:hypothetical protein
MQDRAFAASRPIAEQWLSQPLFHRKMICPSLRDHGNLVVHGTSRFLMHVSNRIIVLIGKPFCDEIVTLGVARICS